MSTGRKLLLGLILAVVVGVTAFNLLFERYEDNSITYGAYTVVTDSPAGSISTMVSQGETQVTYAYRLKPNIAASIGSGSIAWLIFIALIIFWEAITRYAGLYSFWINYGGVIAISVVCFIMGWINVFITFAFIILLGFILAFEHRELADRLFGSLSIKRDKGGGE